MVLFPRRYSSQRRSQGDLRDPALPDLVPVLSQDHGQGIVAGTVIRRSKEEAKERDPVIATLRAVPCGTSAVERQG